MSELKSSTLGHINHIIAQEHWESENSNYSLYDIVDAFLENDITKLMKTHQCADGLLWYKHLLKGSINKVNPINSNLMQSILEAKIDILWGSVVIPDNDFLTMDIFMNIERHLQKYGDTILRLSYVDGGKTLTHKLFRDFEISKDNFGTVEHIITKEWYEEESVFLVQKEVFEENKIYIYLEDSSGEIHPLSKYPTFAALDSEVNASEHPFHYMFTNERKLTDIIRPVNTVDMNLSNIDYTTFRGRPFMLLRQDMASRNAIEDGGSIDEENIEYQLMDAMDFVVKNSYMNKDDTMPMEMIVPDFDITKFQSAAEYSAGIAINSMGLSLVSMDSNLVTVSASSSASSLKERATMTKQTKKSERSQRLSDYTVLFEALKMPDVKIEINDESEDIDPAMLTAILNVAKQVGLSKKFILKELKPNWTQTDITEEENDYMRDKSIGVIKIPDTVK